MIYQYDDYLQYCTWITVIHEVPIKDSFIFRCHSLVTCVPYYKVLPEKA